MIFDHRTYICRPGTIKKHMALYAEHGFAAQSKHLGDPVLYGAVETGDVNSYIHVWCYDSPQHRSDCRAALAADPDWQAYLKISADAGYLVSQVNTILQPASFFKLPGRD
jgi:hypothetical protein